MSTPEHREVAKLLLQKAREDLSAAQVLVATEDQADHVIGFHLRVGAASDWLTPWGVLFRYDDDPTNSLDRDRALEASIAAVAFAERLIGH